MATATATATTAASSHLPVIGDDSIDWIEVPTTMRKSSFRAQLPPTVAAPPLAPRIDKPKGLDDSLELAAVSDTLGFSEPQPNAEGRSTFRTATVMVALFVSRPAFFPRSPVTVLAPVPLVLPHRISQRQPRPYRGMAEEGGLQEGGDAFTQEFTV